MPTLNTTTGYVQRANKMYFKRMPAEESKIMGQIMG
jgi:hypothetical protein